MSPPQRYDAISQAKILVGPRLKQLISSTYGLGYVLHKKLQERGNTIMQVDAITGEEDTYDKFCRRSVRTALHMKAKGLVPGDKISICTYNSLNSTVPLVASFFLGVIPTALDPSFSLNDFIYFLNIIRPKLIFICPEVSDVVGKCLNVLNLTSEIVVFESNNSNNHSSFSNYLLPIQGELTFEPYIALSPKDTAMILFSSGTTGKPKGICLNHGYFFRMDESCKFLKGRVLFYSSLYWISQTGMSVHNIISGYTKIVYPSYDSASRFWDIAAKYKITTVFLPPSYFIEVCEYGRPKNASINFQCVLVGGGLCTKDQIRAAFKVFPEAQFLNFYGQTEVGSISTYDTNESAEIIKEKLLKGSVGKVVAGTSLKIADIETDEILGPNKEGEIRVLNPYMMNSYYNVDSSNVYDTEGWFKTGDVGYYDEQGYIYVVDRCKEMLKYRSFPVSPAILEDVLAQHPAVKQSVVTGLPDERDGDHPIAFVVLKRGANATASEIRRFVDERVDDRKKLRGGVKIIDSIPLTVTGKPKRFTLRDMAINGEL